MKVRATTSPANKDSILYQGKMGFYVLPEYGEADSMSVRADYDGDGTEKVVFVKELS